MGAAFIGWIRVIPVAWRIPVVVALNLFVALAAGGLGWSAASMINADLDQLRQVQGRTRVLADVDIRSSRLQGMIRQYLANPSEDLLKDAMRRSEELFVAMGDATAHERPLSDDAVAMHEAAKRFVAGFQALKAINAELSRLYESRVLQVTTEMSGLYGILNSTARANGGDLLAPALVKSHETFVEALIAINVFYFNSNPVRAAGAKATLRRLTDSMPVLRGLAANDLQRDALDVLERRTRSLVEAIDAMAKAFDERTRVLSDEVDANQAAMSAAIDRLIARGYAHEAQLHDRSNAQLVRLGIEGAAVALALLVGVGWISWMIGQSIRIPLLDLRQAMEAGATGNWSGEVRGADVGDELGAMAGLVQALRAQSLDRARRDQDGAEAQRLADEARLRHLERALSGRGGDPDHGTAFPGQSGRDDHVIAGIDQLLARLADVEAERDTARAELATARLDIGLVGEAALAAAARAAARLRRPLAALAESAPRGFDGETSEAARTLAEMVDDLAEYGALSAGRPPHSEDEIFLGGVISDAIDGRADDARERGVALAVHLDPSLPSRVMGDGDALRRLIVRLIDNAIGFASDRVVVTVLCHDQTLYLRVADDGPGITEAQADGLFRPFAECRFRGSGLGLAIAARLAESMGGRVGAEGRAGRGTTLRCVLPLPPVIDGVSRDDGAAPAGLLGVRVLVMAGEEDWAARLSADLEQAGAATVRQGTARPGRSACDAVVLIAGASAAPVPDLLAATPCLVVVDPDDPALFDYERLSRCLGIGCRPLRTRQVAALLAERLAGGQGRA